MVLLSGIFSCIFSMIASIFSPMPTFYTIWRNKSNEKFQIAPYIASVLNSIFGVYFFILKKQDTIYLMSNLVSAAAGCFYLVIYVVYGTAEQRELMKIQVFIFNMVVPTITILSTNFVHGRVIAAEWLYGGSSVFLYAAPFLILVEVVESRSVKHMPFVLSGLALVRGVASAADAINAHDTLGIVFHSIGCGFGAAQLIIYYYVKKHEGEAGAAEAGGEVQGEGGAAEAGAEVQGEGDAGAEALGEGEAGAI